MAIENINADDNVDVIALLERSADADWFADWQQLPARMHSFRTSLMQPLRDMKTRAQEDHSAQPNLNLQELKAFFDVKFSNVINH